MYKENVYSGVGSKQMYKENISSGEGREKMHVKIFLVMWGINR